MLFCDLVGSTAIAARLDPEDWRDTVLQFQRAAAETIERAGGYVAQHLGDGLLVYFGYPRASEDDAERATRCGLALVTATRALNPELWAAHRVELSLRVGLHTGAVVVGEVGGGIRRETLALGNTANVAARVQGAAEADSVLITASTLQRVRRLFVTRDLGEHALKGIDLPVRLHAVVRASEAQSSFERADEALTPLTGRERELTLLESRFGELLEGGQAVSIAGDAGMGKSRLAHAFRERLAERPHAWLECRAAAYNRDSPLQPLLQLQRAVWGIDVGATHEEKLQGLEAELALAGLELSEAVPLFATLHGIALAPQYQLPPLTPMGLRKRTLGFMADWLLAVGREQDVVVLLEDLHWMDPSSIELIGMLVQRAAESRLLLLLTYRPDFAPPWAGAARLTHVSLERLDRTQLKILVERAAFGSALSEPSLDMIVERSDGVPFFAEELTRALLGSSPPGTEAQRVIPETLEASLMAWLEQTDVVKEVAQLASVLGIEFSFPLLEGLWSGEPHGLRAALLAAERKRVLFRVDAGASSFYFFRHALIRDVAYNSMLRRTRWRHHSAVARTLRERFPETVREQPELLAHHLTEARENDAAIDFWRAAGALALERGANEEAIRQLNRAAALLSEQDADRRALDVQQMLARALVVARGWAHEETKSAWEKAARLCDESMAPLRAGAIACGLGDVYSSLDLGQSLAQFEAVIAMGRRNGLELLIIAGHQGAALAHFYRGQNLEGRHHLDAALALYDPERHHFIEAGFHEEKGVNLLCWSAWTHWQLGSAGRARQDARRALELAQRFANPFAIAFATTWAATTELLCRDWASTIRLGQQASRLGADQGFVMLESLGRLCELTGRGMAGSLPGAADLYATEVGRLASTGNRLGGSMLLAILADLQLAEGRFGDAIATSEMGLGLARATGQPCFDAWLLTLEAAAVSRLAPEARRAAPDVESLFERALETARGQQARALELRAALALTGFLREQSRAGEGLQLMQCVVAGFDAENPSVELVEAHRWLEGYV